MIHFTADLHFGCDKLIENIRPCFKSTEEHDAHLIEQINRNVARNDTLVVIGDFCKEKPGRYRPRIKCRHTFFILGNHDKEAKIRKVFGGNVWEQRMVKTQYGKVWCNHRPAAFWDQCFRGIPHVYGHLHNDHRREAMMDLGMPGRRSMDVGVDSAYDILGEYRPFTESEIFLLLMLRKGHDILTPEEEWDERDFS